MSRRSWLVLGLILAGCTGEEEETGAVPSELCASGWRWAGGNEESPLMHPGGNCIGCHSTGEGPRFGIAGTVHAAFDEPDDCFGVPGVAVTVTDATGLELQLMTNDAGNFFSGHTLTMPIRARLAFDGRERTMTFTPQTGACASCHTATGANSAPGRIVVP
jgi:Fe-S cluster biogenesis protein NfuA